jgi:hypothetical protein
MFGPGTEGQPDPEQQVEVDVTLEQDISIVEQAVEKYLQNPNDSLRRELLVALEQLDSQLADGDAYHSRVRIVAPESTIVGATSNTSIGEELPATEFQAQVALVKAAKNTVIRPTTETLADLRAASEALAERRATDQ